MKGIKNIISRLKSYISHISISHISWWKRLFYTSPFAFRLSLLNRGYTLVEAVTVVAISGTMAIITIPIASDKMEEGKISSARGTVGAINSAMSKFSGESQVFPTKVIASGIALNVVQILRSGAIVTGENLSILDPLSTKGDASLWKVTNPPGGEVIDNLNEHLVSDAQGYAKAGFTWLGPYLPTVDQDPWGKNYLIYVRAFYTQKTVSPPDPVKDLPLYAWILSAGPDKTISTEPTDAQLKGDDIGILPATATPKSVPGISDNKTSTLQTITAPSAPPSLEEAP